MRILSHGALTAILKIFLIELPNLRTTELIAFMKVKCLNDSCGKEFNIMVI